MSDRHVRLSAHDSSFLDQSTDGAPLNVAGFIRLDRSDPPLLLDRVRSVIEERLGELPRLRQRPVEDEHGVRWDPDPEFLIERHVDELSVTAGAGSLPGVIARLHSTPFDRRHPLWSLSLVPQDEQRGPALLFRASHALVDGMSSMQVMRSLFDRSGNARATRQHPESVDRQTAPETDPDAFDVVRDLWQTMRPRDRRELDDDEYARAIELLDGWISILERGWHGPPRFTDSRSIRTRVAFTELDAAALRSVRMRNNVRFDVIGLTITAGAVGRLLTARGESVDDVRIRTLVPVAGAGPGARDALGNRATFLLITVPVGPMTASERLRAVSAEVGDAIASGQHRAVAMSMKALESAPPESSATVSSFTTSRQFVDLVVSCVPGSRRRMTFDGIAHDITYPILPITPRMRVAVGFGDIGGRLGVALTVDEHVMPEVEFFVDAIRRSAADVARVSEAAAGGT